MSTEINTEGWTQEVPEFSGFVLVGREVIALRDKLILAVANGEPVVFVECQRFADHKQQEVSVRAGGRDY